VNEAERRPSVSPYPTSTPPSSRLRKVAVQSFHSAHQPGPSFSISLTRLNLVSLVIQAKLRDRSTAPARCQNPFVRILDISTQAYGNRNLRIFQPLSRQHQSDSSMRAHTIIGRRHRRHCFRVCTSPRLTRYFILLLMIDEPAIRSSIQPLHRHPS
jgi:hypothetical protein